MGTPAPDAVKRLVDRFDQNRKVFLSGDNQTGTSCAEIGRNKDMTLDTFLGRN